MNICLYTIDMYPGTERLMPWRPLVEVARYMNARPGMSAYICSGQDKDTGYRCYESVNVHSIGKGLASLVSFLEANEAEVLYLPVAFRDAFKSFGLLGKLKIQKIAYVPGGIYPLKGVWAYTKIAGVKKSKAYILEKAMPHYLLMDKLKRTGFSQIISFSSVTRQNVIESGWPSDRSKLAVPGLDGFGQLEPDYSYLERLKLRHEKFILFSGAPASVRGSITLLKAFDMFAEQDSTTDMVMLMRSDLSSDFRSFKKTLNEIRHKNRVIVSYDMLSPMQLKAFFEAAYVVALPFLLIPSEIPLTYFEALSCGTPVVTFENGGSTDYIKEASLIISDRSPVALSTGLERICRNDKYRDDLAKQAVGLMEKHPSWEEFAQQWIETIKEHAV